MALCIICNKINEKQLHTCIYSSVELQNCIHTLWIIRVIPDFPGIHPIQVTATLWKLVFHKNILYPMHLVCTGFSKFSIAWNLRNWPCSSGGDFKKSSMHFHYVAITSPKDTLCQVWENWLCCSGAMIFKSCQCILTMLLSSPLSNGVAFHLKKLEFSLPKHALCQVLLKLAQYFWRRRWKCEKLKDWWTTCSQQVIINARLSFRLQLYKTHIKHSYIFKQIFSFNIKITSENINMNNTMVKWITKRTGL